MTSPLSLETLWQMAGFVPNPAQEQAIRHVAGPLYLPAGPGSGKTRVLLWRTLNLMVFHQVPPERIFLSTFTEKAALQLREGLRHFLSLVTNHTGQPFDLSKMYVGTVHALCQRLLLDRAFYPARQRGQVPQVMDELGQFFFFFNKRRWAELTADLDFGPQPYETINHWFDDRSASRYQAVMHCMALFNRFSEECLEVEAALAHTTDPTLQQLLRMYARYRATLAATTPPRTDFALLQQHALNQIASLPEAAAFFQHVIVDEYQDTNTVQERLFFTLAGGHRNLCVVGDDDQAMYRFRGATVENFVQFPARCAARWGVSPQVIPLATNYRSRQRLVTFYSEFMEQCDWRNPAGGLFRVADKHIRAHSADDGPAVMATDPAATPDDVAAEVAQRVRQLVDTGKVADPNQVAFLFPSLKSPYVERLKTALEAVGLLVYAPRAGRFLEVAEATAMFGLFLHIFGQPARGEFGGHDYTEFHIWLDDAYRQADPLIRHDKYLGDFVRAKRDEIKQVLDDYQRLCQVAAHQKWPLTAQYDQATMREKLYKAQGLSERAKRDLASRYLEQMVAKRAQHGQPTDLAYVLTYATSLDWNVLDLFHRLCGFDHFRAMFDLAERGANPDEGPLYNLGLVSQYLARFMDNYGSMMTAPRLKDKGFERLFFSIFLFALFRRGESEFEDANDPFPAGRVPFLTIHQAKGLEFPVVVLGNPYKTVGKPQVVEARVRPLLPDQQGEPLERQAELDAMRLFYVALSRAQNLLIVVRAKGQNTQAPFKALWGDLPRLSAHLLNDLPPATPHAADLPRNYSFTGDYLAYLKCARQYMVFRRYGLVPSRSQTMMFGTLVHRTLDDLHQFLISQRATPVPPVTP